MSPPRTTLHDWWSRPAGAREVLVMAYPLVLSNLSFTVMLFVDRLFLTWYSPEAVAGAVAGQFATWAVLGVFIGTGEYLTTFIAQYLGAGRPDRVGPAVWQGIYFSGVAWVVVAAVSLLVPPAVGLAGHAPGLQANEIAFATIVMRGGLPVVLMATLTAFFAGRGQTQVVLAVNVLATTINVGLDYLWIFGHGGFPRLGVAGAAYATLTAESVGSLVFLVLIFGPRFQREYRTLAGWRFEPALFLRLLHYGVPAGLQFSLEIFAFTLFLGIIGRLGTAPLAATSIAFNLNGIVFVPMLGLGIAVSSLVGRHLGAGRPDLAERATWTAFSMSLAYMTFCGALYVFAPHQLLRPYAAGADPASWAELERLSVVLLRFVALYSIFDMMNVVFTGGLRGAGDTVYPMLACVVLSWVAMLVPAYVMCLRLGYGVFAGWGAVTAYVVLLGLLLLRRFRQGGWKSLRVTEEPVLVA